MTISTAAKQAAASEGLPEPQEHGSKDTPDAGETHWSQASGEGLQKPVPKQFSELDESASSQAPANASAGAVGKQALHDVHTSVDTDRGPVLEAVYNGPVTDGHRVDDDESVHGHRDPAKSTSSRTP